jgi:hypothetical protein
VAREFARRPEGRRSTKGSPSFTEQELLQGYRQVPMGLDEVGPPSIMDRPMLLGETGGVMQMPMLGPSLYDEAMEAAAEEDYVNQGRQAVDPAMAESIMRLLKGLREPLFQTPPSPPREHPEHPAYPWEDFERANPETALSDFGPVRRRRVRATAAPLFGGGA